MVMIIAGSVYSKSMYSMIITMTDSLEQAQ